MKLRRGVHLLWSPIKRLRHLCSFSRRARMTQERSSENCPGSSTLLFCMHVRHTGPSPLLGALPHGRPFHIAPVTAASVPTTTADHLVQDHESEWQLWGLKVVCRCKKYVARTATAHETSNTPPRRHTRHAEEWGRNPTPAGQPTSTLCVSHNQQPGTEQGKGFSKGLSLSGTGQTPPSLFHTS